MKMKSFFTTAFGCLLLFACGVSDEQLLKKAETTYIQYGLKKYERFVNKNHYFAVKNPQKEGMTPLLEAAQTKQLDLIDLFLEKGASVNEVDGRSKDLLDYALAAQDDLFLEAICQRLPQEYWLKKDEKESLPIVKLLCYSDNIDLIKSKIVSTNNPNAADVNGKTLLMYAAQYNSDVRVVKQLMDLSVDRDVKTQNEWTAAMYAARYNPNPLVLQDLLIRGADFQPNSVGVTLTMLAACNPNPGVLLTLCNMQSYPNEINARTAQGKTALMYACENSVDPSVIKILLDHQAKINLKDNQGKTALMYGLQAYSKPEALYLLIAAGANKEDVDNNGKNIRDYFTANKALIKTELINVLNLASQLPQESESDSAPTAETDAEKSLADSETEKGAVEEDAATVADETAAQEESAADSKESEAAA